eukprot:6186379-Ditylum_brightwellii.AAC.1
MGRSTTSGIYQCTDRIPIVDSLFEIPVAFVKHPLSTILLWLLFAVASISMYFVFIDFQAAQEKELGKSTAFGFSIFVVLYQLYKLTGGLS